MSTSVDAAAALLPYVPQLLVTWAPTGADDRHMRVTGSLAFLDISGFTQLTERLARKGKVGAEEMSDVLSATFSALLTDARADGADLVKWGGDAVLLLYRGPDHAQRAARSAHRMRSTLRHLGRSATATGALRMSVGIHSGEIDFFLVGDPAQHRELLISGPAASLTAETEAATSAGQIGLTAATAALLPSRLLGGPLLEGRMLRSSPVLDDLPPGVRRIPNVDPKSALPTPIRDHLLHEDREPEHRLITVAFVQFSGTDQLIRSEGPSALADELDKLVRSVQHACADHEVTFFETDINRDGGKVMLVAGAPRSAGHDEERMLRVARLVLDRAGRLPLRIGINRGRVFSGDFGPPFRRTYSVKGDAINLAARVMGRATPGQALSTLEVLDHSQTVFDTKELPPFMVKGKSRPVRAAALGELQGARVHDQAAVPLAGMETEMAVLNAALAETRARRGRLVDIVGDPGIGKSRLVGELLSAAGDLRVVGAACEEYESSTPYFPFRRLLREVLSVPAEMAPADFARILTTRLKASAPGLVPWLPLLGPPMDIAMPPTREVEELAEQFRKARLEAVVAELFRSVLATPTVVVIEDVHLMDDASADLLRAVLSEPEQQPWLVLLTRQEVPGGFVPTGDGVTSLRPAPLTSDAALGLVRAALEDHPMTARALEALAERGAGNPLFLQALATEARRPSGAPDLPASVEALITSQVDRLDPEDRTVLRYAAVLGTVVDESALQDLAGEHYRLGTLPRLESFIGRDTSGRLRFRSALIRDVAYEGLSFSRRRGLHDQVGSTIERSGLPDANCHLLSLHFFHAERHDRAWRYSVLAAEKAVAKFAHADAIDFLARAAQSAVHAEEVEARDVARVLELLADSRFLVGQSDEAVAAYAQARRRLRGDPVRLAGIIEKEVRIDHRRRRYSQAMRRITRGLHELEGMPGRPAIVARSLLARRYAFSRFSQGRIDEALRWAESAASAAEESLDKDALAQAYETLNTIYAGSGREEPLPYGRLALLAFTELDSLPHQGHCLNNLAVQAFTGGRWSDALADYRRAAEIFARIGDTASESNARFNQAELLVRQGREAEAGPLLVDVLRNARAVQDDELVALALREQARVEAAAGQVDLSLTLLLDARDGFGALGDDGEEKATDLAMVEILLDAGRPREAAGVLDPAEMSGPTALRLLGRLHAAEGRETEARDALSRGLEAARGQADRYEEAFLLHALVDLAGVAGLHERDGAQHAQEILDALGVVRVSPC